MFSNESIEIYFKHLYLYLFSQCRNVFSNEFLTDQDVLCYIILLVESRKFSNFSFSFNNLKTNQYLIENIVTVDVN